MGYTSQSLTPKCTKLLGYCTDDRDCCSHYCNYDTGKCESYQHRSLRSSAAKSRQLAPHSLSYYNEYTGVMKIFLLDRDKDEKRIYGVELFDVYPKAIEVIPLSHASPNTINKLGVSFQYRNWKRLDV